MKIPYYVSLLGVMSSTLACSGGQATAALANTPNGVPGRSTTTGFHELRVESPALSTDQIAALTETPLTDVELCRSAWQALATRPFRDDPFQGLSSDHTTWAIVQDYDGIGSVRAEPTRFSRLSGQWTSPTARAPKSLDCPFPSAWRISLPGLDVAANPAFTRVRGLSRLRPRIEINRESFDATGGLVYRRREFPLTAAEDLFDLAWSIRAQAFTDRGLADLKTKVGIPRDAEAAVQTTAARIAREDRHPIKAISFSAALNTNIRTPFWLLTGDYYERQDATKVMLPRSTEPQPPLPSHSGEFGGEHGREPSYDEFANAVLASFGADFGLNDGAFDVWESGPNRLATTGAPDGEFSPANLARYLLPLYQQTLLSNQPLWVWLVWSPATTSGYFVTYIRINPDGSLANEGSYDLSDPTSLGLPRDPLHY